MKMTKRTGRLGRFDGRVGILYVGCEDNGEGRWNWWVATEEQGICAGERGIVAQGSSGFQSAALQAITNACERLIADMTVELRQQYGAS